MDNNCAIIGVVSVAEPSLQPDLAREHEMMLLAWARQGAFLSRSPGSSDLVPAAIPKMPCQTAAIPPRAKERKSSALK
jgi:hypothetical protein